MALRNFSDGNPVAYSARPASGASAFATASYGIFGNVSVLNAKMSIRSSINKRVPGNS